MPVPFIVVTQFCCALLACALVARWYVLPALAGAPLRSALPPLILPHLVRPISLWLLAPEVIVRPTVPAAFAGGTAYGDLLVTALAIVALWRVRGERPGAVAAAWVFNVVGMLDALKNCAVGIVHQAPTHMGALALVPGFVVPALLVTHVLIFKLLLDHGRTSRAREPMGG